MDKIDYLIRDLCEIPDRNSPDDQPEMLLVTAAEIRAAISRWMGSGVTITAKQLREALEFCNPDGPEDEDQMETELTIWMRETDAVSDEGEPLPRGLYCHLTEYPEEGCMPLFEVPANVKVTGAPAHGD